ncbi:molybdenum ABC transporter substrate-binding protein [Alsobacter metallidurans]|uniref:Molybdenum ABC transporter substrate-binding protein n=1 Tax=Alsobacter metallidurans TaxID=340221 RepID=A0A917MGY7_9HYPH|nr:substrate-binding domain-containing protein [Alsobacter metallidurans]GGH11752.1 molybdenum ABC transporter substrate-binding protein [Alsobacter metallidurans]
MKVTAFIVAGAAGLGAGSATAGEIRLVGTGAVKHTIEKLSEDFRLRTGHEVRGAYATAGVVTSRIEGGEAAEIVASSRASIATLVKAGKVAGEARDLGQVRVAMAVRSGAPKPDLSTPEALKAALLAAASVGYGDPGTGATTGIHFAKLLEQLGVADVVNAKANLQKDGLDVMKEVAEGRAAVGITQASEVQAVAGVDFAGYLPEAQQLVSTYTAALTPAGARNPVASAFLAFIAGPEGKAAFKAAGFD